MGPRISFVMPAWKSQFIQQAISSIVTQTSPDWELIVVDDCSPDPIQEIVASFCDSRIQYIRNQKNIGGKDLVAQWNHSITFARGEFIVLAGDDDLYKSSFCAECIRLIDKYPTVDLIHSPVETIDESGDHLYDDIIPSEFISKYEYLNLWITGQMYTCIGNYAFRRTALLSMGGFIFFPCAFGSDVATPIALSKNDVANTPSTLFCFRISHLHLSSDRSKFREKLEAITQLSAWLQSIKYSIPITPIDKEFYSVVTPDYLHRKVVYDYFNLVIKFLPFNKLYYLKYCFMATPLDKFTMVLRWIKKKLLG